MAAGVTSKLWEMADMVKVLEDWEVSARWRRGSGWNLGWRSLRVFQPT